ncbi:Vegetative incompatibility HET-E-1-like protein [Cladobotryum mycophilum]|uniref:Vegetative incompatibility HET-E-1-like protein n=1 Tax=Cladobotryum mycophilum TaxID=491253 RepID=A0ABR0SLH6_9HYPO
MSSNSPPPSPLEQEAIGRARSEFAKWNDSNKSFQNFLKQGSNISDLVQYVQNNYNQEKKKASFRLLEQVQPQLDLLQAFSTMVDATVYAQSGIACPMWAPITFVLKIANLHSSLAKQITKMIDTIVKSLPRFDVYQQLQPDTKVQTALLNVFTEVLIFSFKAHRFFKRNMLVRLWKLFTRNVQKVFEDIIDRLESDVKAVDDTAFAVHMKRITELQKEQQRVDIQKWLGAPNMNEVHRIRSLAKLKGTCKWILLHDTSKSWLASQNATADERFLYVSGKSGCGKSTVASSVVDFLKTAGERILFFSFSGTEECRQRIDSLVRSFLSQTLQGTPDEAWIDALRNLMSHGQPATLDLWKILQQAFATSATPIYWVIDGLDECHDPIEQIRTELDHTLGVSTSSKMILFGRPHVFDAQTPAIYSIEMDSRLVQSDLNAFIEEQTKQSPILKQSELRDMVQKGLLEKSDGMFLWVKLLIDDIRNASSVHEVKQNLQLLPRGLQATYQRILQRLTETLGEIELRMAHYLLGFIIASGRTLTIKELEYAQALAFWIDKDPPVRGTLQDYLLSDPTPKFLRVCGGLVDIQDGKINLVHVTAKEYLTRPAAEWVFGQHLKLSSFRIDIIASHELFANICFEYLTHIHLESSQLNGTIDSQVTQLSPFLPYVLRYMEYHSNMVGDVNMGIQERFKHCIRTGGYVSWIETAMMELITEDAFADNLHDFTNLLGWIDDHNDTSGIEISDTFKQQLEKRRNLFGDEDWRTRQSQFLVNAFSDDDEASKNAKGSNNEEECDNDATPNLPEHSHEDNLEKKRAVFPPTPASTSEMIKLLAENQILPKHKYTELFLVLMSTSLGTLKRWIDPLELLFQMIIQKASTIPILFLYLIGNFYYGQDKFQKALEVYEASLAKMGTEDTRTKLLLWNDIGNCYFKLKMYEDAVNAHKKAALGRRELLGPEHEDTADSVYRTGIALHQAGEYVDAEMMLRQAADLWEKIGGPNHKARAWCLHWLGTALFYQKKYVLSEEMSRQAISVGEANSNLDEAWLAYPIYWAGCASQEQGNYSDAERMFHRAGPMLKSDIGLNNLVTANDIYNTGKGLLDQGKYCSAENMYRLAASMYQTHLGLGNDNTANALFFTGQALFQQEKYGAAEEMYRQAASAWESIPGYDGDEASGSNHWIGRSLYRRKEFAAAEEVFCRVAKAKETKYGAEHEYTLTGLWWVAWTLRAQDKNSESEETFSRLLPSMERVFGLEDYPTRNAAFYVSVGLRKQGKCLDAEEILRRVLAPNKDNIGDVTERSSTSNNDEYSSSENEHDSDHDSYVGADDDDGDGDDDDDDGFNEDGVSDDGYTNSDNERDGDGDPYLTLNHIMKEYHQIAQELQQQGHHVEAAGAFSFLTSLGYTQS